MKTLSTEIGPALQTHHPHDLETPLRPLARFVAAVAATLLTFASAHAAPADSAYNWLVAQKGRSGLYASFQGGNIAYTYDQTVAAIAFLLHNDPASATALLSKLQSLQGADGSFYDSYYSATGGKQQNSKSVGPVMWVALAVMNYEKLTGDTTTFRPMATKAINWALQFQQSDGGLNGGLSSSGTLDTYASTEHNIDAYAALTYFGYATQAAAVKSFLDNVAWSTDHFLVGRPNGDTTDALDVNPWGVMALGLNGTHPYYLGLNHAMSTQRNVQTLNGVSYDGFDFEADKNDIWFEGTNFMVVALNMDGDPTDANYFLGQIVKDQSTNGGVQYSLLGTNNGYWTMSNKNAISSTGWLILASANYNPFAQ